MLILYTILALKYIYIFSPITFLIESRYFFHSQVTFSLYNLLMRINIKFTTILITLLLISSSTTAHATEFTYVDVSNQLYTYESMVEDMIQLASGHEDIMSFEAIATTVGGRNVWLIKFGNLNAENKIFITASIHAREYMTSQLVMRMLEEYVLNFDVPRADGTTYRQIYDSVCFYILPMVNPDGVTLSQFSGNNQIKANANGVDLNRNFPLGFGQGSPVSPVPSPCYYPGSSPFSEIETTAIATLLAQYDFVTCVNYHSMGNIIYYGAATNSPEVNTACRNMAALVSSINGYRIKYCGNAIGSLADYFGTVETVPSVTIEIGTANPVPISQFTNIYNCNVPVWPVLAGFY